VREGVPFIVPGAQMFLPMLMIDLRERFSKAASRIQGKLSPVSQLVVIYQILREPDAHIPLAQLGKRLAYSPQAVSFAQEELKNSNLRDVRRSGKIVFLEFRLRRKALWEKAEPLMARREKGRRKREGHRQAPYRRVQDCRNAPRRSGAGYPGNRSGRFAKFLSAFPVEKKKEWQGIGDGLKTTFGSRKLNPESLIEAIRVYFKL
jgi:hypothetical protein